MTTVSKSKSKEHARQLNQLNKLQGAITKKSSTSTSTTTPLWRRNPLGRIIDSLKRSASTTHLPISDMSHQDPDVVREFDRDISECLVSVSGSFLGMNPNELMQSNGLRQLIARNMRWFQNTPDWMKIIGLVVAKKFNGEVRNRNAILTNAYQRMSSSSSSFVNEEDINTLIEEEALEVQPLLLHHQHRSLPIPIPTTNQTTQEDHISFFNDSGMVSSSSSDDKMVQKSDDTPTTPQTESVKENKKKSKKSSSGQSIDKSKDEEDRKTKKKVTKDVQPPQPVVLQAPIVEDDDAKGKKRKNKNDEDRGDSDAMGKPSKMKRKGTPHPFPKPLRIDFIDVDADEGVVSLASVSSKSNSISSTIPISPVEELIDVHNMDM